MGRGKNCRAGASEDIGGKANHTDILTIAVTDKFAFIYPTNE